MVLIPLLYFSKTIGFIDFTIWQKIASISGLVVYFGLFFILFKKVFNLASFGLQKENLKNSKIVKSLLTLGFLNCIPFFMLIFCYCLGQYIPTLGMFLKIFLAVFTFVFYISMSLSLTSIVKWQDKNIFCALFKGLKTFFKKIHFSLPLFLLIFGIGALLSWIFCVIAYTILIYAQLLNDDIINTIHAVSNIYSLYVICGLYISFQIAILKDVD